MSAIMIVREYSSTDLPQIMSTYHEAVHTLAAPFYAKEQLDAWAPPNQDSNLWEQRLAGLRTIVSEEGGLIAGFASFDLAGHLDLLFVNPRFARRGVATRLCTAVEQDLRIAGVSRIFTEASLAARAFFDRSGFRVVAEETVECRRAYLRRYAMDKIIDPPHQMRLSQEVMPDTEIIRIRQALTSDTDDVAQILCEAAEWLQQRNMPMWRADELSTERIAPDVAAGQFFVAECGDRIVGTVKFQWSDELFWPDVPADESAYVHRLAVSRDFAGGRVSGELLRWAAERARAHGRHFLRLDCEASRSALRAVYERFGFRFHSERQVGPYFVARYEQET